MSSMCSMPTLKRMLPGPTPAAQLLLGLICRCVVEAGWQARDFASPRFTSRLKSFKRVVEAHARRQAAAHVEGEQRAGTPAQIFLHQPMVGAVGEAGVVDRLDARVAAQELRDLARVLDVALDPQRDRLDALQQQERVHRREHRAHGALVHAAAAADEGGRAVVLGVDQPVIGLIRLGEHRIARGVLEPRGSCRSRRRCRRASCRARP